MAVIQDENSKAATLLFTRRSPDCSNQSNLKAQESKAK